VAHALHHYLSVRRGAPQGANAPQAARLASTPTGYEFALSRRSRERFTPRQSAPTTRHERPQGHGERNPMKTAMTLGLSAAMMILVACGGADSTEESGTSASNLDIGACRAAADAAGGFGSAAGRAAYSKCLNDQIAASRPSAPAPGPAPAPGGGGGGGESCESSVTMNNGVGTCVVIKNGNRTETACNGGVCECNCQ
jgi:hypothetical protein